MSLVSKEEQMLGKKYMKITHEKRDTLRCHDFYNF